MNTSHESPRQQEDEIINQRIVEAQELIRLGDVIEHKGIIFSETFRSLSPTDKSKALDELKRFISLAEKYWTEQGWLEKNG